MDIQPATYPCSDCRIKEIFVKGRCKKCHFRWYDKIRRPVGKPPYKPPKELPSRYFVDYDWYCQLCGEFQKRDIVVNRYKFDDYESLKVCDGCKILTLQITPSINPQILSSQQGINEWVKKFSAKHSDETKDEFNEWLSK